MSCYYLKTLTKKERAVNEVDWGELESWPPRNSQRELEGTGSQSGVNDSLERNASIESLTVVWERL